METENEALANDEPKGASVPPALDEQSQLPQLTVIVRSLAVLAAIGLALGFFLATKLWRPELEPFLLQNQIGSKGRAFLLSWMFGAGAAFAAAGGAWLLWKRKDRSAPGRLLELGSRIAPASCLGFLPLLFRWHTWKDQPLTFLAIVSAFAFAAWGTVRISLCSPPLWFEQRVRNWSSARAIALRERHPRVLEWLPFALVGVAAAAYVLYFSYYTIAFHHAVRSGYDLGIKNNIFWNTLHGAPFKASPTLGPDGLSHFGRHADLLVYALLPIYYFCQKPETLLVLQSLFIGGAAIPLYAVARSHVGRWPSALIALVYLLHPAIHGPNLFEFHFLPLGLPLLWAAWAMLERKRYAWAAVFAALTLFTREDVALWVVILGAYQVMSGRRPRAGMIAAVAGSIYFVLIKFVIMPKFAQGESFTDVYDGLIPQGSEGFSAVLKTLAGNPAFTLSKLLTEAKLIYLLQVFLPLAFIPLKRPIFALLAIPGFLLTILPPHYRAVYDIYFQYSPHWLAFLLPATALGIEAIEKSAVDAPRRRAAALVAMACAAIPVSYQYGAILQQHTARGGPIPYTFGMDANARARHQSILALQEVLPKDAKVACSGMTAPQFSSRADAYDMNQGFFDAEWLVFPTDPREFIVNEKRDISKRLSEGTFGVVKIEGPFALAKKGHPTTLNGELLTRWR